VSPPCKTNTFQSITLHLQTQGTDKKYTEYSQATGITRDNQSTSLDHHTALAKTHLLAELPELIHLVLSFATARDWTREKIHTPRNLVLRLMGEVGELAEVVQSLEEDAQWSKEVLDHLSQELADVAIYALRLISVWQVEEAVVKRMKEL